MKIIRLFFIVFVITLMLFPVLSWAADMRIVPCEGTNCQACHVKDLLVRVINFIIMIASLFGTMMFMWAGFIMVTAAGNHHKISEAKSIFKNVAIGIVITLSGFMIVDAVMQMLLDPAYFQGAPWEEITCVPQPVATRAAPIAPGATVITEGGGSGGIGGNVGGGGSGVPATGDEQYSCAGGNRTQCVEVARTSVQSCAGCSFGGNCDRVIDPAFAGALGGAGGGWCASSIGIEPGHGSGCHLRGNCIDAKCAPGGNRADCTPEGAATLQRSFMSAGLKPVYELPPNQAHLLPQFKAAGVCAYVEPRATGAHFSVYHGSSREGNGQFARAGGTAAGCP